MNSLFYSISMICSPLLYISRCGSKFPGLHAIYMSLSFTNMFSVLLFIISLILYSKGMEGIYIDGEEGWEVEAILALTQYSVDV